MYSYFFESRENQPFPHIKFNTATEALAGLTDIEKLLPKDYGKLFEFSSENKDDLFSFISKHSNGNVLILSIRKVDDRCLKCKRNIEKTKDLILLQHNNEYLQSFICRECFEITSIYAKGLDTSNKPYDTGTKVIFV